MSAQRIGGGVESSTWQRGPLTVRLIVFGDSLTVRYDASLNDAAKKL